MARVYRDAYGVPHVRATSVLDLARAQGRVVAHDRPWQLEWLRRRATGTTAEVFGEVALPWDRFARHLMLLDVARGAFDALSQEAQAFVTAYVDGVNEGLHADAPELAELGIEPQPWDVTMPLATFHAQHVLFSSLGSDLWKRRVRDAYGPDAELMAYEPPFASGSNAWAVGGERTATGKPLIGGDPHRVIESPGVYLQVRLACEDPDDSFDVLGFAFAGVPGVQHFAHAGDVAWAITNAAADQQDVCDETVPPQDVVERRHETIEVKDAASVDVEVVRTARGLVFEPGLSVRDAATVAGHLGFEALLPLLRARTVDDVDRALDHWVEPANNAIIADVHGTVRYRIAGLVPTPAPALDRAGEWTGWLDPVPRTEVPPDGQVLTANERRGPESADIGTSFAPPYRADRLRARLTGATGLTVEDFAAIHNDAQLATVPLLTALVPGAFDDFDGRMEADSHAAGRFAAWRSALVLRIAAEPVFDRLREPRRYHDPVFDAWLGVVYRVALALPQLARAGTPFGIDVAAHARAALDDVAGVDQSWGDTHVFAPLHAFDTMGMSRGYLEVPSPPLSGDTDCVRCTGSYPGSSDECYRGSVARYAWDLADRSSSGWVVPTGASGHPDSPHHHDQLDAWAAGDLLPVVTDWDELELDLTLEP